MTEQEARAAKIGEVWAELMRVKGCFDARKPKIISATELLNFATLRAVLLERCQFEHALTISDGGIFYRMGDLYNCTTSIAKDHGSAWLFMAWELKQRSIENGK